MTEPFDSYDEFDTVVRPQKKTVLVKQESREVKEKKPRRGRKPQAKPVEITEEVTPIEDDKE